MAIEVEALEGWDAVQNVRDPNGTVHQWDVYDEETGTLRTDCGIDFYDRDRSPNWTQTEAELTCEACDQRIAQLIAQGRD